MQRIPFAGGWAITQEPGLPVPDDEDDDIIFEESPASPDPSSPATSCYEITASGVVSESSSIPTSGLPTPPPTVAPPVPIAALIRAPEILKPAFRFSGNNFAAKMRRGSNVFYPDLDRAYLYQKRRGFLSLSVGALTAPRAFV